MLTVRRSILTILSRIGTRKEEPGPFAGPCTRPSLKITPRSYSLTMRTALATMNTTTSTAATTTTRPPNPRSVSKPN
jgi:hypothetical protein